MSIMVLGPAMYQRERSLLPVQIHEKICMKHKQSEDKRQMLHIGTDDGDRVLITISNI